MLGKMPLGSRGFTQMASAAGNSSEGFLLLDSSMNPILINAAAVQILDYPKSSVAQTNLNDYLAGRIRSTLLSKEPWNGSTLVPRFKSGRRKYVCRTFQLDAMAIGNPQISLAVILERAAGKPMSLVQLSERFHLTGREQEVAQFLLQGLTSKEIGARMQISANTVKAFLRLIMIKMGVSTRSGVVGKALVATLEASGALDYVHSTFGTQRPEM
jgi:DNA-binding CsgD family transcriptional regulator